MLGTTLRLAARNTLRRKVRTSLTAGMVMFGVALLLLLLTWVTGATKSMLASATAAGGHVRVVDPDFAAREELSPLDEHLADVERLAQVARRQPGVTAAEPRIAAGVTVTAGEEIGEVFARAVGANDSYFRERLKAHDKLVEGRWFGGGGDELVVGARVAKEAKARVGDELLLLGVTQDGSLSPIKGRVVGIVRGAGELDQQVLVPLARMQYLADIGEGATELLVYGDSWEDAAALAASLRVVPELKSLSVLGWPEREPWKSVAATAKASQTLILLVVVFLVALGIWNTMMMSVLERTSEIGVLRALGMTRFGAVRLFLLEALAIGSVGGLLGAALGSWPSYLLATHGMRIGEKAASNNNMGLSEVIYGDFNFENIVLAFGLGLLMAVLGSLAPAIRAASIQPVSAMRSGR